MSVGIAEPMPNFSGLVPASNALAPELWISFAALLRSHVAMRSITEPNARWQIVSNEPSSLEVRGWNRWLRVTAREGSQAGIVDWLTDLSEKSEPFATFSFGENGQIFFVTPAGSAGREAMEMEAAVEWLLDKVRMRESR